jgi:hypothetical protein
VKISTNLFSFTRIQTFLVDPEDSPVKSRIFIPLLVLAVASISCAAELSILQKTLRDEDVDEAWIYNDLTKGIEEARKSKKPLLITLRCVP